MADPKSESQKSESQFSYIKSLEGIDKKYLSTNMLGGSSFDIAAMREGGLSSSQIAAAEAHNANFGTGAMVTKGLATTGALLNVYGGLDSAFGSGAVLRNKQLDMMNINKENIIAQGNARKEFIKDSKSAFATTV